MKKTDLPSKTFCVNPWLHMNIQADGAAYHCCLSPLDKPIGNVKDNTLEELWNSPKMKEIRKDMIDGKRHSGCTKCYHIEDTGMKSPRDSNNSNFADSIPTILDETDLETGHNDKFQIKYWDIRWSNICNFKCRMCGVFSSSKWADDDEALHGIVTKEPGGIISFKKEAKSDIMEYVDKFIMDVEEIYFAGGEPLIMEEHYEILEKLIAAGRTDVRLRYNTNFSHLKFKKWDLMGLWKPFRDDPKGSVKLAASLDAVGKLAEIARNGTKWNQVEKNLKYCVDEGIDIHIAPTISVLNAFYVYELVDLAIEFGIPPWSISLNNILVGPAHYDIRVLPFHLKEKLKEELKSYIDKCELPEYKAVLTYGYDAWMNHMDSTFQYKRNAAEDELVRSTMILDERRGENFLSVNPQYKEWFGSIRDRQRGILI
jgi:radical SAM protein with 4Fe4S-binding SPASM domain